VDHPPWTRVPNGGDIDQIFGVLVCLPTAPVLPSFKRSGGFGTSPFYGQLSDKPHQLAYAYSCGVLARQAQEKTSAKWAQSPQSRLSRAHRMAV
jgi:hypothetical protein